MNNKRTLKIVKAELWSLRNMVILDPRVAKVIQEVRAEREPRIKALEAEAEALRKKRPGKKPRWPAETPGKVIEVCNNYWQGTTEYLKFRIHCWNDKAVCTSYPSGGYSDNGGWHPCSACFHFLSLTETEYGKPKRIGLDLEGRQSAKQLQAALEDRTK